MKRTADGQACFGPFQGGIAAVPPSTTGRHAHYETAVAQVDPRLALVASRALCLIPTVFATTRKNPRILLRPKHGPSDSGEASAHNPTARSASDPDARDRRDASSHEPLSPRLISTPSKRSADKRGYPGCRHPPAEQHQISAIVTGLGGGATNAGTVTVISQEYLRYADRYGTSDPEVVGRLGVVARG